MIQTQVMRIFRAKKKQLFVSLKANVRNGFFFVNQSCCFCFSKLGVYKARVKYRAGIERASIASYG